MEENKNFTKPYMGNLTSEQIGSMAKSGQLGGEMVRRMIEKQEMEMAKDMETKNKPK